MLKRVEIKCPKCGSPDVQTRGNPPHLKCQQCETLFIASIEVHYATC